MWIFSHVLLNYKVPDWLQPLCHIFLELDFPKLQLYVEFKFHELEFQNSDRLLNISQIAVVHWLFRPNIVFSHFCLILLSNVLLIHVFRAYINKLFQKTFYGKIKKLPIFLTKFSIPYNFLTKQMINVCPKGIHLPGSSFKLYAFTSCAQ